MRVAKEFSVMFDAKRVLVRADLSPSDTYTTFGFWNVTVARYEATGPIGQVCLFAWNVLLFVIAPLVVMAFATTLPKPVSKTPLWPLMFVMIGVMMTAMVAIFVMAQASLRWSVDARFKKGRKS